MKGHPTKSQRAKQKTKAQRKKDYQDQLRKGKIKLKGQWYAMFIGTLPINELYKCFNITP